MKEVKRMETLIETLNDLNYYYYTLDNPKVSDKEYDSIYDELKRLEKDTAIVLDDSPTQRIGGDVLDKFEKHTHIGKLWSLDKSQSIEELVDWDKRVRKAIREYNKTHTDRLPNPTYAIEHKFDGLTVNLTYKDGKLEQAATRGNGEVGEGILEQVKTIKNIPLTIPFKGTVEVQGEGLMPLPTLKQYNETHDKPLKNARNAAAGALRNLNPKVTAERGLVVYCYNIGYIEGKEFDSYLDILGFLDENRLPIYKYDRMNCYTQSNIDGVIDIIKHINDMRKSLDILTDGAVVKINDIKTREVLGYTMKFPKWAIAYKFEANETTTKLLDIKWNVGRTGKITPVAILEPVDIDDVTVQRATLNNWDDILRKKVRLNSRVLIRRSNDVIPEIMGTMETEEETYPIEKPEYCPACGDKLVQDGVHMFCTNSLSCKPQLVSRMVHFASRDAMNIEGLSEKTIEKLLEELDLKNISEIYSLEYKDIVKIEGFKRKKTNSLLQAIEKSKECTLDSFIYALGIPNVGLKTARDLANHFKSLDNIKNATYKELKRLPDIGSVVARSIIDFFKDKITTQNIKELLNKGVNPVYKEQKVIKESIFTNKKVVITGTIEGYTRKDIKELVESMGGKVISSVSKNTDYVIAGENTGSKYDKAIKLGVDIIDKNSFKQLI